MCRKQCASWFLWFQIFCILAGVRTAPAKHLKVTAEGDTPKLIVTSEEDFGIEPKRLLAAKTKLLYKLTTQQTPAIFISSITIPKLQIELTTSHDSIDRTTSQKGVQETGSAFTNKSKLRLSTTKTATIADIGSAGEITTIKITDIKRAENKTAAKTTATGDMAKTPTTINNILSTLITLNETSIVKSSDSNEHNTTLKYMTGNEENADGNNVARRKLKQYATTTAEYQQIVKPNKKHIIKQYDKKLQHLEQHTLLSPKQATTTVPVTTESRNVSSLECATKVGKLPSDGHDDYQEQSEQHKKKQQKSQFALGAEHELVFNKKTFISTAMSMTTTTSSMATSAEAQVYTRITDKYNDTEMKDRKLMNNNSNNNQQMLLPSNVFGANIKNLINTVIELPIIANRLPITTSSYEKIKQQAPIKNVGNMQATVENDHLTTATTNMDVMMSDQQNEEYGVLKLLDLEKNLDKTVDPRRKQDLVKQKHESQNYTDMWADGHDGIKKTKKKQLKIDNHILTDIAIATHSPLQLLSTPLKNHQIKMVYSTDGSIKHSLNNRKLKEFLSTIKNNQTEITKLKHTAYLGPIHMQDKIYGINKSKSKQRQNTKPATYIESHFSNEDKKRFTSNLEHIKKIDDKNFTRVLSPTTFEMEKLKKDTATEQTEKSTEKTFLTERTESKISDIQVEVYDSTVDSIVASTNFKQYDNNAVLSIENVIGTTKPPAPASIQEKFTQYVIDRVESSTQESSVGTSVSSSIGKPEPAAIEIHINVSEGIGNISEDLEFSYPQTNYDRSKGALKAQSNYAERNLAINSKALNTQKTYAANSDEILVVEVIDTNDNTTEKSASGELAHPISTFNSENMRTSKKDKNRIDEIFMADLKEYNGKSVPSAPPATHIRSTSIDHDSDTIFYISNTEVKVGESMPTSNTDTDSTHKPAYLLSTLSNLENVKPHHRFEEAILLSPLQNTADSLKIFRSQTDNDAPPLDVTYVGESVMEVEQSPISEKEKKEDGTQTLTTSTAAPAQVIIQPATLSEIGVPVIGELPPQIELKEFDFMPDELTNHEQRIGGINAIEDEEEPVVNGNDVERLVESSIQYGGDLIDEGAVGVGSGFDGVEGYYPFGNLDTMRYHGKAAKHAKKLLFNHGVSNLRKDILSVDVNIRNSTDTFKDIEVGNRTLNEDSMNITYAIAERLGNVTAASMLENPKMTSLHVDEQYYWGILSLGVNIVITALPVLTIFSMFCGLRYFYNKYQSNSNEKTERKGSPPQLSTTPEAEDNKCNTTMNSVMDSESPELVTTLTSNIREIKEITSYCSSTVAEKLFPTKSSTHGAVTENLSINNIQSCTSIMVATISVKNSQTYSVPKFEFNGHNGSVTKMTLKNNHLIVETEQRNDISRNARETKMHYNNSTGQDGVFVVEVARGVDSIHVPESPVTDNRELSSQIITEQSKTLSNKQMTSPRKQQEEVQIHLPPSNIVQLEHVEMEHLENIENHTILHSNTGLSQSDLSSSSTDSNKAYIYGKQTLYVEDIIHNTRTTDKQEINKIASDVNKLQTDDDENEPDRAQNVVNSSLNAPATSDKKTIDPAAVNEENFNNKTKQMQVKITAMKPLEQVENLVGNVLDIEKVVISNKHTAEIDTNNADSVREPAYASLMSLPEPPCFQEIKHLSSTGDGDINQLDSLPLPPPPPLFLADLKDSSQSEKAETQLLFEQNDSTMDCDYLKIPPTPSHDKELLSTQLTPPESPPATNCSNGIVNGNLCAPFAAVAVNVNGS